MSSKEKTATRIFSSDFDFSPEIKKWKDPTTICGGKPFRPRLRKKKWKDLPPQYAVKSIFDLEKRGIEWDFETKSPQRAFGTLFKKKKKIWNKS